MDKRWRPLDARKSEKAAEDYDALHDGIPDWLKPSVRSWIQQAITALCETTVVPSEYQFSGYDPNEEHYRDLLQRMERELRLTLNWKHGVAYTRAELLDDCMLYPRVGLRVVDYLLRITSHHPRYQPLADQLGAVLVQGGSMWSVATQREGLEERVAPEVAERAAELITSSTPAGYYLREAWRGVHGYSQNPTHAYDQAVKAVEAAAIPVVCPNDAKATLGRIIGTLRAAAINWELSLQPSEGDPTTGLIAMMDLLWRSQRRHGTADPNVPSLVSKEEAEAAVHLALTLVRWFQSGAVRAKK